MQVESTAQSGASQKQTAPPATTAAGKLDYNAFLKLLIAQMQNQDPTKPIDSTEFVAQLASFSNVEQGIKMNSKLDSLMTALALTQADGLIGHTLKSADGKVTGVVDSVRITTGGAVAHLTNGKEVTLEAGITVSRT